MSQTPPPSTTRPTTRQGHPRTRHDHPPHLRTRARSRLAALLAGALAVAGLAAAGPATARAAAAPAAPSSTAGSVTALSQSGGTFTVSTTSGAKARVSIARADIFRLWLSPDGSFTDDPAGSDLAPTTDFGPVAASYTDAGTYYRITTGSLSIHVGKSPLMFSVYRADDSTPVWQETQPTKWGGGKTVQTLARGADEQFYGTGLRLGEWALRDKTVPVAVDNNWRENDNASPAPFYMSTNDYGVMRNTWAPGSYAFNSPTTLTHDENRFDAWYFTATPSNPSSTPTPTSAANPSWRRCGASNSATPTASTPPTPPTRATTAGSATRPPPTWSATPPTPAPPTCPRAGSCPTTATAAATPRP